MLNVRTFDSRTSRRSVESDDNAAEIELCFHVFISRRCADSELAIQIVRRPSPAGINNRCPTSCARALGTDDGYGGGGGGDKKDPAGDKRTGRDALLMHLERPNEMRPSNPAKRVNFPWKYTRPRPHFPLPSTVSFSVLLKSTKTQKLPLFSSTRTEQSTMWEIRNRL